MNLCTRSDGLAHMYADMGSSLNQGPFLDP